MRLVLAQLYVLGILAGCTTQQIGGPVAPRDATDAGLLTLESGRSFPVYPDELAYTGLGSYRWPDGREHHGQFLNGRAEGMGTRTWPNGDVYRGTWHQDLQHGHGELTRADGSRYVGDFVSGKRQGSGVEQTSDGLYRGSWQNDLPNGEGSFHGTGGDSYEGQWVDGLRQGQGNFVDVQGNRYQGEWFNDFPDGFGVMENANGSIYQGEWQARQQNGYGRMVTEAGVVYEGTWVDGKRQGFGVATRPDGSRYEGHWQANQRHGQGRESFADGSSHQGAWEFDRPLGPGTREDRTGIEISGVWNGDALSSGLMRLPSGREYAGRLLGRRNTVVDPGLLEWLDSAARADDPWAHFFLGTAYTDFASPAPDPFVAIRHFRAAAVAELADAQFRLALLLMPKAPAEAMDWLRRAAAAGQAQANTLLGEYTLAGRGVAVDQRMAAEYFRAGAAAGDMAAVDNLAWLLVTSEQPGLRDPEAALRLIRPLALMQGDWQHLDTLAAVYAALGNFPEAVRTEQQAILDAARLLDDQSEQLTIMRNRLQDYQDQLGTTSPHHE